MNYSDSQVHSFLREPEEEPNFATDIIEASNAHLEAPQNVFK
jgi:hypothetical protein